MDLPAVLREVVSSSGHLTRLSPIPVIWGTGSFSCRQSGLQVERCWQTGVVHCQHVGSTAEGVDDTAFWGKVKISIVEFTEEFIDLPGRMVLNRVER